MPIPVDQPCPYPAKHSPSLWSPCKQCSWYTKFYSFYKKSIKQYKTQTTRIAQLRGRVSNPKLASRIYGSCTCTPLTSTLTLHPPFENSGYRPGEVMYNRAVTTMRHLRQLPPRSNQEVQCSVQTLFWPQSHALIFYFT